jgi:hypothetical protein
MEVDYAFISTRRLANVIFDNLIKAVMDSFKRYNDKRRLSVTYDEPLITQDVLIDACGREVLDIVRIYQYIPNPNSLVRPEHFMTIRLLHDLEIKCKYFIRVTIIDANVDYLVTVTLDDSNPDKTEFAIFFRWERVIESQSVNEDIKTYFGDIIMPAVKEIAKSAYYATSYLDENGESTIEYYN